MRLHLNGTRLELGIDYGVKKKLMKNYILIGCLFLFIGCKETKTESKEIENTETTAVSKWESLVSKDGSQPVQRHEAAFVRVGGKFYLFGGRSIRPLSIFDPKTGS